MTAQQQDIPTLLLMMMMMMMMMLHSTHYYSAAAEALKVGWWTSTEGVVWGRGLPVTSYEVWGVTPRKLLKIQVQICAIWCIFGDQCNRKCTSVFNLDFGRLI